MKTEVKLITPEMAEGLLTLNIANRQMRIHSSVQRFIEILKKGEWILTHQGIAISESGVLLDGQHRLMAIYKSGISALMLVSTNVNNDAFMAIDTGLKRTLSDISGMTRKDAEILKFLHSFIGGRNLSPQDARKMFEKIGKSVESLREYSGTSTKFFSSVPFRSAAVVGSIIYDNEFSFSEYKKLVNASFSDISEYSQMVVKNYTKGMLKSSQGSDSQANIFNIALNCFNKFNVKKSLRVSDIDIENNKNIVKRIIY